MPTYTYRCPTCVLEFEEHRPMTEDVSTQICPKCDTVSPQIIKPTTFLSYSSDGTPVDGFAGPEVRMRARGTDDFKPSRKIFGARSPSRRAQ